MKRRAAAIRIEAGYRGDQIKRPQEEASMAPQTPLRPQKGTNPDRSPVRRVFLTALPVMAGYMVPGRGYDILPRRLSPWHRF